jgi:hypothetical protein
MAMSFACCLGWPDQGTFRTTGVAERDALPCDTFVARKTEPEAGYTATSFSKKWVASTLSL